MGVGLLRPLAITHTLADRYLGGIERYVLNLSESLRARGYSVSFILSSRSPVLATVRQRGFPYVAIPFKGDLDPRIAWQVAHALRRFKPDLLHIHDSPSIVPNCLGARWAGVPSVTTVHAFHTKWGFLLSEHLITVSTALRRHMLAQGFREEQITTVRSGVDVTWFKPQDRKRARTALGLAPDTFYFAAICRLARRKGLGLLLETIPQVLRQAPQARVLFAGTGPLEEEFQQQAAQLGISEAVQFLGFQEDVRPVLSAANCVVLPSDREGLGLVLLEAMASARAVIATDSGGPAELVHHEETGLLIPPKDPDALAAAMLAAVNAPAWVDDMGERARFLAVKDYSLERQVDGVEVVYHRRLAPDWKTQHDWQPRHLSDAG